jgi:hypothetical protein
MPLRDLALAGRALRKSLVFALTAVLTIALGVGASTAIFSVANAVLLRALPYKNPDELVIIPTDMRNRGVKDFPFSNANFIDLREATKDEFQGLAGVFTFPNTLTGDDGIPEQVHMGFVTTNYFQLVGRGSRSVVISPTRTANRNRPRLRQEPNRQRPLSACRLWRSLVTNTSSVGSDRIPVYSDSP